MTKIKTLLFVLAIFMVSSYTLLGQITHQVHFAEDLTVETMLLEDGNSYSRVMLSEEYATIDTAGHPNLPVRYIKLLLPPNTKVSGIEASFSNAQSYTLEHPVEPVQHPIPTSSTPPPPQNL